MTKTKDTVHAWTPLDAARPMRHLRAAAGLTMDAAAARLGCTRSGLTSPEAAGYNPSVGALLARAEGLGLEVEIRIRPKV